MLGGALIGLVIGVIAAAIFWYMASKKRPSFDLPVARSETFSVAMAPAAVIAKVSEAAPTMKMTVALSDDAGDRVILEEGMSFASYGVFVRVTAIGEASGAAVTVDMMNKAPQWGPVVTRKHRALVERIKGALGVA